MGAHGEFAKTRKQTEIVEVVLRAVDAGELLNIAEIRKRISWGSKITRSTLKGALEGLIRWGILEKQIDKTKHAFYKPTPKAYHLFRRML
jgi:hypothetical protein